MADFLNGLFISEILADNAGAQAVDVDGDGNTNKADEFIEIGNASGAPISLNGIEVWSEKNGQLFAFGASDTLNPGAAATVVGNYSGTVPGGFYNAGIPENGNFIPDGEGTKFDTLFLVDTNTGNYIALSYGSPPVTPTLPTGFPGTNMLGTGESIASSAPNGVAFARDASGTLIETTPTPGTPDVACFAEDTVILTNRGEMLVSDLRAGDLVPTYDRGAQPLLGICAQHFSARTLLAAPNLRPLRVAGKPFQAYDTIRLSPAHCLFYQHAMAEALFSSTDVLVRARHMQTVGHAHVEIPRTGVTYYHLLFSEHALVLANGIWCESYLNLSAVQDITAHNADWEFFKSATLASVRHTFSARPILRRHETEVLFASIKPRSARPIDPTPEPKRVVLRVV